jgi:tryptophan synthase alpha chain
MTLSLCLEQTAALRAQGVTVPIVLMNYYNPIFQMGLERFALRAATADIDGVIVPDLPPEESDALQSALRPQGIDSIFLLAPTSEDRRVRLVVERVSGFLSLVSLTGVTGARDRLPPDLESFVARVRPVTDLPLAVGFGISRPDQAARVARMADGVIVGSALLKAICAGKDPVVVASPFIASLRAGIDESQRVSPAGCARRGCRV